MLDRRTRNHSVNLKTDFFNEIQAKYEESYNNANSKLLKTEKKKYNIKSSLFYEKDASFDNCFESKRYNNLDISTNISDLKVYDYSFISKIDNNNSKLGNFN